MEPIKAKAETVRFTVDLDHDLHRALKQWALDEGCPATDMARYAIRRAIAEKRKTKP